jgi:hypothetical protein
VEETTTETTAAPTATPTPRPTATPTPVPSPTPVPEPVLIENVPITEYVDATTIGVGYGATYPTLKFETEDAVRINAEVLALAEEIEEYSYTSLRFQIIENTDTVFTLLVIMSGEDDYHEYHPYVIDSSTGTLLSNEEILSMAGVDPSSLHDRAVTSIQDAFNDLFTSNEFSYTGGNPMYVNGEVCDDGLCTQVVGVGGWLCLSGSLTNTPSPHCLLGRALISFGRKDLLFAKKQKDHVSLTGI